MLLDTASDRAGDAGRESDASAPKDVALGPTLARLLAAVEDADLLFVASTEQRGEAIARAAARLTDALVLWCPPADALPGEAAPSSPAIAGKRFAALNALHRGDGDRRVLFVTDAIAAARKLPPPSAYQSPFRTIRPGDALDGEVLEAELEAIGYGADERVDEPGEMAIRGGAIDLFPADGDRPVRIHLEEGRVESISAYDPVTQLGGEAELETLAICPAEEPEAGADAVSLFDHLPRFAVALDSEAEERRDRFLELAEDARARAGLVRAGEWRKALSGRRKIDLGKGAEQPGKRFVQAKNPERSFLAALKEAREQGDRIVVAGSERDLRFFSRRMERRLGETPRRIGRWSEIAAAQAGEALTVAAELERGWVEPGLMVVAAADMLGGRAHAAAAGPSANPLAQEAADFHLGDAVIHEDHGLGILRGLEVVTADGTGSDAIRLEYAGETQRLVPVEEADRLWRYGADAEAVSPDRLDGSSWQRRRAELDRTIAETARQLVQLSQERSERTAAVLDPSVRDYERFAAGFPFSETADQARAIQAVRNDLASGKPMDRLVVGDVGYGKTEVALRAAAIAALAGKQVALVAPTTVLVRQHIETFRKRFGRMKIKVAGLSRLSSATEAREVKKGLADGSIQVVVGTKMVAGKGVAFQDLALVIVDEEQRFGAADKAKLRALAADAHVLTLTATPIPRTLQTALVGLQDLSLITTPPARRLPTRTAVAGYAAELVRPALLREKKRGGQSFVVVPRIEDMAPMAERLGKLVPSLSIRRAHGKMPAAEIDEEMVGFASGDGDILLATNIIEAGLDIPRANTMLVWRADRFGLAQLHQLRGRVGRGRLRGSLLLLTQEGAEIASATLKRLRTMEALDQLGAGFAISARDLDLRGAGELLGEEQAGHMKLIGLDLYQHLLEQALRAARGDAVDDWMPELHLGMGGRLPENWIPEEEVRINLYVRLARTASGAELDALADELEDRFGTLPPEAEALLRIARIRLLAREARIERVDAGPAAIALTPRRDFKGKAPGLEKKGDRLLLKARIEDEAERLARIGELLESLSS
jgi:transcription-repair coupling factor (superfamily II helicase)